MSEHLRIEIDVLHPGLDANDYKIYIEVEPWMRPAKSIKLYAHHRDKEPDPLSGARMEITAARNLGLTLIALADLVEEWKKPHG